MPDIVTSKTFVDGEKGITATKMNQIISGAVIQPAFYSAKPSTPTLDPTDALLDLKGTGAYAQISGAQLINSVSASVTQNITPTIWAVRLRSFNAIGNPAFEVDQRQVGAALTNPANLAFALDRYQVTKSALTGTVNTQQVSVPTAPIVIPGTNNFGITRSYLRCTVGTAQASLAASDYFVISQSVEGPRWRELSLDVHSISLLVRSSVAGLAFGVTLRDSPATKSLASLCTIPAANTWTLLALPNIPVWPTGANLTAAAGTLGYSLSIALAAGTTFTAPANNTWQNGNFLGALGQSNFLATAGATFDIAFISHEPGNQCSNPPMDCPFQQAYDDCLRYYAKSYNYATASGTPSIQSGLINGLVSASSLTVVMQPVTFPKPMAKPPTVTPYSYAGVVNQTTGPTVVTVSSIGQVGEKGYGSLLIPSSTAGYLFQNHYIADTGW